MMYKMAFAFVEILADVNFVSIAITRTNNSVAAIAGKGWVTASAARREAGLWAVLQRTGHRSCRVVPHHVVLQSRRMTAALLQSRRILRVGTSVSSRRAKHIWSHFIYPRKYSIQPMNRHYPLTLIPHLHVAIWAQATKQHEKHAHLQRALSRTTEQAETDQPLDVMADHGRSRSPRHVRSGAGAAEHTHPVPRIRPSHFHYLKQAVANATQVPLTHAELSTASARGAGLKPATGGQMANVHGDHFPMRSRLPPRGQCRGT